VEETYRIGFALGARYQALTHTLRASGGDGARETTESVFPFIEARGEVQLGERLFFEGWGRGSLFTISHREVVDVDVEVHQYVDAWGNIIHEEVVTGERQRYLITQINGLLDLYAGVRWDLPYPLSVFGGLRFTFMNAERIGGGLREDMEWRAVSVEMGVELRF
jgi:hypothetical protein